MLPKKILLGRGTLCNTVVINNKPELKYHIELKKKKTKHNGPHKQHEQLQRQIPKAKSASARPQNRTAAAVSRL